MKIENRYQYLIKKPNQEKINELACEIARAEGMNSKIIFTLIRWPSWVSPPSWDLLEPYYHLVVEFREKARAQLMKEWADQPRVRIKRYKKIKRPNRKRYWTRRPTKYGQSPPPRRQGYIPLEIGKEERQEVHIEECSTKRPSRRDWRQLLFETSGEPKTAGMKGSPPKTLFDN